MKKKFSPIMIVHLVLLILMILFNAFTAIMILSGSGVESPSSAELLSIYLYGIISILNIIAFVCGVFYLLRRYSKQAAGLYKAFMLLFFIIQLLYIWLNIHSNSYAQFHNFVPSVILASLRAIFFLIFGFWKDLGKRNTWIIFGVYFAMNIITMFLFSDVSYVTLFIVISKLSGLLKDGTIGLAIRGKYADKDARGTK